MSYQAAIFVFLLDVSTQTSQPTTQPSALDWYAKTVDVVGHLAWPVLVFVALCMFYKPARAILTAINERIHDKNTDVELGKEGIKFKTQIEAGEGGAEALRTEVQRITQLLTQLQNGQTPSGTGVDDGLRKLAASYDQITANNYFERVRLKDQDANRVASYVVEKNIPRNAIASEVTQGKNGLIVAIAGAVVAQPAQDDAEPLLTAGSHATWKHTQYRVCLAVIRLAERRLIPANQKTRFERLLADYEQNADESLKRIITRARAALIAF